MVAGLVLRSFDHVEQGGEGKLVAGKGVVPPPPVELKLVDRTRGLLLPRGRLHHRRLGRGKNFKFQEKKNIKKI